MVILLNVVNYTNLVWSGLVWSGLVGSGRVGSGRVGSGRVGSGRVESVGHCHMESAANFTNVVNICVI